jgi:hypothetical protein
MQIKSTLLLKVLIKFKLTCLRIVDRIVEVDYLLNIVAAVAVGGTVVAFVIDLVVSLV